MNIIDAIRTGKRFRRAGQSEWIPNADYHRFMLNRDEMLANDWLITNGKRCYIALCSVTNEVQ